MIGDEIANDGSGCCSVFGCNQVAGTEIHMRYIDFDASKIEFVEVEFGKTDTMRTISIGNVEAGYSMLTITSCNNENGSTFITNIEKCIKEAKLKAKRNGYVVSIEGFLCELNEYGYKYEFNDEVLEFEL